MFNPFDKICQHFIFSQRFGYEPLPEPMRLEQISQDLRREIWNTVIRLIADYKYNDEHGCNRLVRRVSGNLRKIPEDEISLDLDNNLSEYRNVILNLKFNKVIDFIEIILLEIYLNHQEYSHSFTYQIECLFETHAAAYRLDTSKPPYCFQPCASKEQGDAIKEAIKIVNNSNMAGAKTHLRKASKYINAKQYAESITNSIHAVESVACKLNSDSRKSLGPALTSLQNAGILKHEALKKAFLQLYGYTSDEEGMRHSLIDKDNADVGLDEAIFMFGACASFSAYLSEKHRKNSKL